ncbi:MAG: type IV pili methyl-accepting chemotaxis transducer N-terminal domain-containing protein [Sulfurimonas sp.]|jgi:nitrate/nitrite-specific signal transduction histidine kinase|uniref:type IV pili methyl-accepting chemotaxis transducer N-terminal domain-containing protein n=1 Tax=Sulfurimonas sp. TaxID=2022749 RepID=UPI002638A3D6|nr:type IV pili methyl-accepting chemotaxis transducer N-terminal domain-containing protein [Sulfurimonas sp.]MDD3475866.1 type IV pili methyl-accepting chemotaxis transducer N-terminal domain-containing protein [Sulfurimonas sp.]
MIKSYKISTKIKFIGAMLIFLIASVIGTTIYLNHQNMKDALVINIAGKQRMLTQKISKNIFYTHYQLSHDFSELDSACNEFIDGLNTLKFGNSNKEISPFHSYEISTQISEVDKLWREFYENVQNFKLLKNAEIQDQESIDKIVAFIYKDNSVLLKNVDILVTLYTLHSEEKTNFIKNFQYTSGFVLFLLFLYSLAQLKSIESHVDSFMQYSKMLVDHEDISNLSAIKIEAESEVEIKEVSDTINCFINKINSAVEYSNEALLQSQKASSKLEELTDEFDVILKEIKGNSSASAHLNNSEDMVIESTEVLISSTKKLSNLKSELDKLIKSCQDLK